MLLSSFARNISMLCEAERRSGHARLLATLDGNTRTTTQLSSPHEKLPSLECTSALLVVCDVQGQPSVYTVLTPLVTLTEHI